MGFTVPFQLEGIFGIFLSQKCDGFEEALELRNILNDRKTFN